MITLIHDGEDSREPGENCVFCFTPTHYWHKRSDVAVCQNCATTHKVKQLPLKKDWIAAVDTAITTGTYVCPTTQQRTPVIVHNARLGAAAPDYDAMKANLLKAQNQHLYHVYAHLDLGRQYLDWDGIVTMVGKISTQEQLSKIKMDIFRSMKTAATGNNAVTFGMQNREPSNVVLKSVTYMGATDESS